MTTPATVLNPLAHPDVRADWDDYETRNRRANSDYHGRVQFREVRRPSEQHLYRAMAS